MRLAPLLRIEHDLHGNTQRGCILDIWHAHWWLLIRHDLIIQDDYAVRSQGEHLRLQDADAGLIVEVVNNLAEIINAST